MKNTTYNSRIFPLVSSTEIGKIVYMNDKATRSFVGMNIGDSILPKIDEEQFYKNTMYRHKLDLISAKDKKYKNAIMKVFSKYIEKMIEFLFIDDEYFEKTENRENIKKMFHIFMEDFSMVNSNADIRKIVENIVTKLLKTKAFIHKEIKIESQNDIISNLKVSLFEVVVISFIAFLNELDFSAPVSIFIDKDDKYINLKFTQNLKIEASIKDIDSFVNIYPYIIPRIEFINSICEREKIKLYTSKENEDLILNIKIPIIVEKEEILHAHIFDSISNARIDRYISLIAY